MEYIRLQAESTWKLNKNENTHLHETQGVKAFSITPF